MNFNRYCCSFFYILFPATYFCKHGCLKVDIAQAPQTELDIPSKTGLFLGHFEFLFNSTWDYSEKQVVPIFLEIKIGEGMDIFMLVEISCFVVFQANCYQQEVPNYLKVGPVYIFAMLQKHNFL